VQRSRQPPDEFAEPTRKILGLNFYLFAVIAVLTGLLLRISAVHWGKGQESFAWDAVRELGLFLSVAFAVAFLYEWAIHREQRELFLHDLKILLDQRVHAGLQNVHPQRYAVATKAKLLRTARSEVLEVGKSMRSFVSYFDQLAATEFRDVVRELVHRGVNFHCMLLDPEFVKEDTELSAKIQSSLQRLEAIQADLYNDSPEGKFQIWLYRQMPCFACVCIDGDVRREGGSDKGVREEANAKLLFSPYMFGLANSEAPSFEIHRADHPILFDKFRSALKSLSLEPYPRPSQTTSTGQPVANLPPPAASEHQVR
jgi:hypothetical protein